MCIKSVFNRKETIQSSIEADKANKYELFKDLTRIIKEKTKEYKEKNIPIEDDSEIAKSFMKEILVPSVANKFRLFKSKDIMKYMGKTKICIPQPIHSHENFSGPDNTFFLFLSSETQKLQGLIKLDAEIKKDKNKEKPKYKFKIGAKDFKYTWKILCDCDEELALFPDDSISKLTQKQAADYVTKMLRSEIEEENRVVDPEQEPTKFIKSIKWMNKDLKTWITDERIFPDISHQGNQEESKDPKADPNRKNSAVDEQDFYDDIEMDQQKHTNLKPQDSRGQSDHERRAPEPKSGAGGVSDSKKRSGRNKRRKRRRSKDSANRSRSSRSPYKRSSRDRRSREKKSADPKSPDRKSPRESRKDHRRERDYRRDRDDRRDKDDRRDRDDRRLSKRDYRRDTKEATHPDKRERDRSDRRDKKRHRKDDRKRRDNN